MKKYLGGTLKHVTSRSGTVVLKSRDKDGRMLEIGKLFTREVGGLYNIKEKS
jgi:hypothetical protein